MESQMAPRIAKGTPKEWKTDAPGTKWSQDTYQMSPRWLEAHSYTLEGTHCSIV